MLQPLTRMVMVEIADAGAIGEQARHIGPVVLEIDVQHQQLGVGAVRYSPQERIVALDPAQQLGLRRLAFALRARARTAAVARTAARAATFAGATAAATATTMLSL